MGGITVLPLSLFGVLFFEKFVGFLNYLLRFKKKSAQIIKNEKANKKTLNLMLVRVIRKPAKCSLQTCRGQKVPLWRRSFNSGEVVVFCFVLVFCLE